VAGGTRRGGLGSTGPAAQDVEEAVHAAEPPRLSVDPAGSRQPRALPGQAPARLRHGNRVSAGSGICVGVGVSLCDSWRPKCLVVASTRIAHTLIISIIYIKTIFFQSVGSPGDKLAFRPLAVLRHRILPVLHALS
jgi:hypothetical protein